MPKQYALSINHVSKTLGGQKRINDMSIHCEYGQIYGLIGPNGSGKTTLLKLITGLYQPDEGEIFASLYLIMIPGIMDKYWKNRF